MPNEGRKKILVVDDEIYIVHILEFSLCMAGYEVATATDGAEALARIEDDRPDLVVLDRLMPVMTGDQVLDTIRRDPALQDLPVIMLLAGGRADAQGPKDAGATDVLLKPFSPRKLIESIEQILEQAQDTR